MKKKILDEINKMGNELGIDTSFLSSGWDDPKRPLPDHSKLVSIDYIEKHPDEIYDLFTFRNGKRYTYSRGKINLLKIERFENFCKLEGEDSNGGISIKMYDPSKPIDKEPMRCDDEFAHSIYKL